MALRMPVSGMDERLKRTALMIVMTGSAYGAPGATATGTAHNFDGILIIAVLIILGLVVTIGLLIYTLTRFAGKVRRRFTGILPGN